MIDLNNPDHRNNVEWSDGQPAKVGAPMNGLFPVMRNIDLEVPYFLTCKSDGTSRTKSNRLRLKTPRIDWDKPLRMQGGDKLKVTKTEPQCDGTIKVAFGRHVYWYYTPEGSLLGEGNNPTHFRHLENYTPEYRSLNAEEMEALVGTSAWAHGIKQVVSGYHDGMKKVFLPHENMWVSSDWLREHATYDKEGKPVAVEV